MRLAVLSITTVLALSAFALATDARAQESLPDPFASNAERFSPAMAPALGFRSRAFVYEVRYRDQESRFGRAGSGFFVPLGSLRLMGQGSSYYPASNQKIRNERLHFAWRLSDDSDFLIGASRFKLHQQGIPGMREMVYGIGFSRRF